MAEPVKAVAGSYKQDRPQVFHVDLRESVELFPAPPQTRLTRHRVECRPVVSQTPALDMELDRALGGVVVRYTARGEAYVHLIPMANIRSLRLAEQ